VAVLRGESSRIYKDEHDESDEEEEEEEEKDAVRREEAVFVAGNVVSHSLRTFWARSLRVAEEAITLEREKEREREETHLLLLDSSTLFFFLLLNYSATCIL
jgi:hypothetical protein